MPIEILKQENSYETNHPKTKSKLEEMFEGWDGTYPKLDFSWEDIDPVGAEQVREE